MNDLATDITGVVQGQKGDAHGSESSEASLPLLLKEVAWFLFEVARDGFAIIGLIAVLAAWAWIAGGSN